MRHQPERPPAENPLTDEEKRLIRVELGLERSNVVQKGNKWNQRRKREDKAERKAAVKDQRVARAIASSSELPHSPGRSSLFTSNAENDNEIHASPNSTVFESKRLITRKSSDKLLQEDMALWTFKLEQGPGDQPLISFQFKVEAKKYLGEEISSMVLVKMIGIAEAYLSKLVKNAIVTVPTSINAF